MSMFIIDNDEMQQPLTFGPKGSGTRDSQDRSRNLFNEAQLMT